MRQGPWSEATGKNSEKSERERVCVRERVKLTKLSILTNFSQTNYSFLVGTAMFASGKPVEGVWYQVGRSLLPL